MSTRWRRSWRRIALTVNWNPCGYAWIRVKRHRRVRGASHYLLDWHDAGQSGLRLHPHLARAGLFPPADDRQVSVEEPHRVIVAWALR